MPEYRVDFEAYFVADDQAQAVAVAEAMGDAVVAFDDVTAVTTGPALEEPAGGR